MKIRKIILVMAIVVCCSCNSSNEKKHLNISTNSIKVDFLSPNNIEFVEIASSHDVKEKKTFSFYEGNKLRNEATFCDGVRCKEELIYDSITGQVSYINKYIVQDGKTLQNGIIYFDENGNINIEKSNFLSISASKDSVNLNEEFELKVKLEASLFPKAKNVVRKLIVGELDKDFHILNIKTLKVVSLVDKVGIIKMKFNKLGNNEVRGFVIEKTALSDSTHTTSSVCFSYPIYVRGDTIIYHPYLLMDNKFYDSLLSN